LPENCSVIYLMALLTYAENKSNEVLNMSTFEHYFDLPNVLEAIETVYVTAYNC